MNLNTLVAAHCLALLATSAYAACVEAGDPLDPDVQVMRCAVGIKVAAETAAARSSAAQMAGHPRVLQLDVGALAVAQTTSDMFEVLTPDAVVMARGGEWGVSVAAGHTQVVALRGEATLTRRWDNQETRIGASDVSESQKARFARLHDALRRAAD